MLGLDLREHFKQLNNPEKKTLSPLAQVLLLQYMNEMLDSPLTTKYLVQTTNYSPMTVNRAFKQLAEYKFARLIKVKREKQLIISEDKATLWQKSLKHLKSPIKKTLLLDRSFNDCKFYRAGEMALSEQSMLISPIVSQFAIGQKQWQKIKDQYHEDLEGKAKLEIWYYNPGLISQINYVDKYSLYLSLSHNGEKKDEKKGERIKMALEELISA